MKDLLRRRRIVVLATLLVAFPAAAFLALALWPLEADGPPAGAVSNTPGLVPRPHRTGADARVVPERPQPLVVRIYSSTFLASTSSGTFPPRTTVSLNPLSRNLDPSAVLALSRWRLISLWPTL